MYEFYLIWKKVVRVNRYRKKIIRVNPELHSCTTQSCTTGGYLDIAPDYTSEFLFALILANIRQNEGGRRLKQNRALAGGAGEHPTTITPPPLPPN